MVDITIINAQICQIKIYEGYAILDSYRSEDVLVHHPGIVRRPARYLTIDSISD